MEATAGERGVAQSAYRIEVRDPKGALVWDSKKTDGSGAVHIVYGGSALKAATRYAWTVTVWTQAGATLTASSWFETGLMDPSPGLAAWGGATWIGGGDDDLVLYSPYLAIFDVKYVRGDCPGQHARELRLRRERLAADGQEQEHLPGAERARTRATSSWNSTSRRSAARRTARRSSTSTAPATRTPTTLRSRSRRSTSTAR